MNVIWHNSSFLFGSSHDDTFPFQIFTEDPPISNAQERLHHSWDRKLNDFSAPAESPLIIEIPHAGTWVPPSVAGQLNVTTRTLAEDADLFVDLLYQAAPKLGASVLRSNVSRFVVDLNRSERDFDNQAVAGGPFSPEFLRGVIWRLSSGGKAVLMRPLDKAQFEDRLTRYYHPYHRALQSLIETRLHQFGFALILAAHSMPSRGGAKHLHDYDVVLGTLGRSSADTDFISCVDTWAKDVNYTISHDVPYKGGFVTSHYGKPHKNVHVVQLELSRALYMNEKNLCIDSALFDPLKEQCEKLIESLISLCKKRKKNL